MSEDLEEIIKQCQKEFDNYKPIKKIKMKQDFYDKLATEVQHQVNMIEVRDVNMQTLNTIYSVKIEIDNSINDNFEVII